MWYSWGTGIGIGWAIFGLIMMVAFWAAIIAGIVLLVRWIAGNRGQGQTQGGEPTALEILKRRYARGEISKEEFEAKKKDLV